MVFFHSAIPGAQIFRKKYPENTAVCRQKNQPPHPQKTAAGTSESREVAGTERLTYVENF